MNKAPDLKIKYATLGFMAEWENADYRFHVWLKPDRTVPRTSWNGRGLKQIIYRNRKDGVGRATYLDFNAKKYDPLREAIKALPQSAFDEARAESERQEAEKLAARAAAAKADDLETLRTLAAEYGFHLIKIEGVGA
jgi:hypothetical protein